MKTASRIATVVLLASAVPALASAPAHAGGAQASSSGNCSGSADWKIKAKQDNSRIEVEAEIDSNVSGQTWHWKLRHDGKLEDRGTKVTRGRSGSFSVTRRTDDNAGTDSFKFRATHNGQVCVARVRL
jgi:hypothetical protein